MIGEPLVSDSRVEQIEARVRQEVPTLPDAARFVTYVQPAGMGDRGGVMLPIPQPVAVAAIVLPAPGSETRQRWIRGSRWLHHFQHFEKQHSRIVGAPDVLLDDFRQLGRKAAQVYADSVELAKN